MSKCVRSLHMHPEPLLYTQLARTEQLSDHTVKAWSGLVSGACTHTPQKLKLTSNKLDTSSHTANCTWDEVRDAAAHESCECHQKEEATSNARHYCADPPLETRDAVEGGVAPTLLQHHCGLPLLIPHRVGAAPKCAKGYGLVHLCPQQPVGHEEANTGGSSTQQGQHGPDNTRTCQTRRHGKQSANSSHSHWTNSSFEQSQCCGKPRNEHLPPAVFTFSVTLGPCVEEEKQTDFSTDIKIICGNKLLAFGITAWCEYEFKTRSLSLSHYK